MFREARLMIFQWLGVAMEININAFANCSQRNQPEAGLTCTWCPPALWAPLSGGENSRDRSRKKLWQCSSMGTIPPGCGVAPDAALEGPANPHSLCADLFFCNGEQISTSLWWLYDLVEGNFTEHSSSSPPRLRLFTKRWVLKTVFLEMIDSRSVTAVQSPAVWRVFEEPCCTRLTGRVLSLNLDEPCRFQILTFTYHKCKSELKHI